MKRTNYTQLIAALGVVAIATFFSSLFKVRELIYSTGSAQAQVALWFDLIIFVLSGGLVVYLLYRENIELHSPPPSWWKEMSICILSGLAFFLFLSLLLSYWKALGCGALLGAVLVKLT